MRTRGGGGEAEEGKVMGKRERRSGGWGGKGEEGDEGDEQERMGRMRVAAKDVRWGEKKQEKVGRRGLKVVEGWRTEEQDGG